MFCYSQDEKGKDLLIAICDKSILGQEFEFRDTSFKVGKDFYGKNKCKENKIKEVLKEATIINAVGKNIINFLIENEVIDKENIIEIGDTVHAQMAKL